jgi:hypothetical protein
MADVPQWRLAGDWFDVCRCRVPCGCTFAQAPDDGQCDGILAWHVREGNYGDQTLDGLNVVAVASFKGNIWAGEAKPAMGIFIDERADEGQRGALQTIFGGDAGGWPAGFAAMIDEVRGIEYAPIDFEIADDLAHWSVEVPGKARGSAEALTGPDQSGGSARAGPQRPRRRGRPGPGGHLGHRQGGRSGGIRVQVELARSVQQALPLRLVRTGRGLSWTAGRGGRSSRRVRLVAAH